MKDRQDEQELNELDSVDETALRRSRSEVGLAAETEPFKVIIPPRYRISILLFSIILAGLSMTLPDFFNGASVTQMESLYIGQAFSQGQLPYVDMFAKGGLLYYASLALAQVAGSAMWLIFLEIALYLLSGLFFFKLVYVLTDKLEMAATFTPIFYLLQFGLGLGGLYASQWAMTMVLGGLWLLLLSMANLRKDEWFIAYGLVSGFGIFLDVRTLIFWILAFISLSIYNIRRKRWKRGFYQNLCTLWGFLLVFFAVGYFALNLQLLLPYIQQTILSYFTDPPFGGTNWYYGLAFQAAMIMASGLLYGFVFFAGHLKDEADLKGFKWLIFVSGLVYLGLTLLAPLWQTEAIFNFLPFGLLLAVLAIDHAYSDKKDDDSATRQSLASRDIWFFFMKRQFFLPLLIGFLSLGLSTYRYVQEEDLVEERQIIAKYIQENTDPASRIYSWDTTTAIYMESQRLSSSQIVLPHHHTNHKANQSLLEDQLLQHEAAYVIVNKDLALPEVLAKDLQEHYDEVVSESVKHFQIFRIK